MARRAMDSPAWGPWTLSPEARKASTGASTGSMRWKTCSWVTGITRRSALATSAPMAWGVVSASSPQEPPARSTGRTRNR